MNAPQTHSNPSYPRPILYSLGIVSLLFLVFDYFLIFNIEIYSALNLDALEYYLIHPSVIPSLLDAIQLFIMVLFFMMFVFYLVKNIIDYIINPTESDKLYLLDGSDMSVTLTNMLTFRRNGITNYHLITLSILLIHFTGGHFYIVREYFFKIQFIDSINKNEIVTTLYALITISIVTLIIISFSLVFLKDKLALDNLPVLLNRILPFLLLLAFETMFFIDIEGVVLAGTVFTYSLLLLSIIKIQRPSEVKDMLSHISAPVSKSIILVIGITIFLLIFSFFGFSYQVLEVNGTPSLLNIFNIVYFLIMILVIVLIYYLTKSIQIDQIERSMHIVTLIAMLFFLSLYIIDDFMFWIDHLGNAAGIHFLGAFLLIHLPASILLGLLISYGPKLSTNLNTNTNVSLS